MSSRIVANRRPRRSSRWPSAAASLGALLLLLLPHARASAAEAPATAATTSAASLEDEDLIELDEVIVYGNDGSVVEGISAESELDAAGIAAYGANTVGDLLGMVAPDVDNTAEGPVILINGRPANGINSVNDLPSESVQSVQVLSPQAAAALGYAPTRRVINVVLRQSFRQDLANVTVRGATAGRGHSGNANVSRLQLSGNSFRNFSLRHLPGHARSRRGAFVERQLRRRARSVRLR
jgi:hypothetical protein